MRDLYDYNKELHGPSMFAVEAKIYGVLYNKVVFIFMVCLGQSSA